MQNIKCAKNNDVLGSVKEGKNENEGEVDLESLFEWDFNHHPATGMNLVIYWPARF